jgi:phosphate-selective porin OprO/OprP
MRSGLWARLLVLAALAQPLPVGAESDVERRVRALEEALREAQREIERLREEVRQRPPAPSEVARPAEAPAKPPRAGQLAVRPSYVVGKGLTVESEDGRFAVSLANRLQARYTFLDEDPAAGRDDTSSFRIRRMKTVLEGHVLSPTLLYKLQVNWAGRPELEDALVHWRPRREVGVMAGQYKVPFNRQHLTSSGSLQFVDRAVTDDFFAFARDQGLTLTGAAGFGEKRDQIEWSAGVFNGNGINRAANENSDHLAVARLLLMPLGAFRHYVESDVDDSRAPRLGIGAAYAHNAQVDPTASERARIFEGGRLGTFFGEGFAERADVQQATADVHFKFRGLSVLGDYFWAEARPAMVPSRSAEGFNVQAGYFLLPKRLEAAFRYARVDRETDERRGLREIGGALGWFFLAHNVKLQADVRSLHGETPARDDRDTMEYRTHVQVVF